MLLPLFGQSLSGQDVEDHTLIQEESEYNEVAEVLDGFYEEDTSADSSFVLHAYLPSGFPLLDEDTPSGEWAWDMTLGDIVAPPANNDASLPLLRQNVLGLSEASANADVIGPDVRDVQEAAALPPPSPTLTDDLSLGPAKPHQDHVDLAPATNPLFASTSSLPLFDQSLLGLSWIQDVEDHTFIREEYNEPAGEINEEEASADFSFKLHEYLPSGFPLLDEDAPSGAWAWDMTVEDIVAPSANSDTSLPLLNQNVSGLSETSGDTNFVGPNVQDIGEAAVLPQPSPILTEESSSGPATPHQDHVDLAPATNSLFASTTSLPLFD